MGSPVSVVAEIVMQHVEELALATCRQAIPLWLRYVDDTFTAVHKDERKWKTSFSGLFGKPRQQPTTNAEYRKLPVSPMYEAWQSCEAFDLVNCSLSVVGFFSVFNASQTVSAVM